MAHANSLVFKDNTPKKDNNRGIHTYEGSEIANIGLGQHGFDVLYADGDFVEEDATVVGSGSAGCKGNNSNGWVAFKAVGGAADVQATANVGMHFTDTGVAPTFSGSGNEITVADTDIVYGNFKKIYAESLPTGTVVLCYRG